MKILIIDDEKISRKVLLRRLEGIGDCTAAGSSRKGFELATRAMKEKKPYDLITMDVSMPVMDGPRLLKKIRKKEAGLKLKKADRVKIIMVTSRMNISTIKECIKLGCDGYLSKPVNKYQLLGTLGNLGFSDLPKAKADKKGASRIVPKIIKRFYAGKIQLPVLPGIVAEVQALMAKPDKNIDDFSKIVEKDIVIGSRLISIANSSLYRGVERVANLNDALVRLGMKAASALISGLTAKDLFQSENKHLNELLEKLWAHSFACGCLAKRIGEELKNESADALFLMGIVHDIGKMFLIKAIADIDPEEMFDEDVQVGIHEIHTTFGAVLLKRLRFTREFIQVAEFHHWNNFSETDDQELAVVNLADTMANAMGYGFFHEKDVEKEEKGEDEGKDKKEEEAQSVHINACPHLGLEKERLQEIAEEMRDTIQESANAF